MTSNNPEKLRTATFLLVSNGNYESLVPTVMPSLAYLKKNPLDNLISQENIHTKASAESAIFTLFSDKKRLVKKILPYALAAYQIQQAYSTLNPPDNEVRQVFNLITKQSAYSESTQAFLQEVPPFLDIPGMGLETDRVPSFQEIAYWMEDPLTSEKTRKEMSTFFVSDSDSFEAKQLLSIAILYASAQLIGPESATLLGQALRENNLYNEYSHTSIETFTIVGEKVRSYLQYYFNLCTSTNPTQDTEVLSSPNSLLPIVLADYASQAIPSTTLPANYRSFFLGTPIPGLSPAITRKYAATTRTDRFNDTYEKRKGEINENRIRLYELVEDTFKGDPSYGDLLVSVYKDEPLPEDSDFPNYNPMQILRDNFDAIADFTEGIIVSVGNTSDGSQVYITSHEGNVIDIFLFAEEKDTHDNAVQKAVALQIIKDSEFISITAKKREQASPFVQYAAHTAVQFFKHEQGPHQALIHINNPKSRRRNPTEGYRYTPPPDKYIEKIPTDKPVKKKNLRRDQEETHTDRENLISISFSPSVAKVLNVKQRLSLSRAFQTEQLSSATLIDDARVKKTGKVLYEKKRGQQTAIIEMRDKAHGEVILFGERNAVMKELFRRLHIK